MAQHVSLFRRQVNIHNSNFDIQQLNFAFNHRSLPRGHLLNRTPLLPWTGPSFQAQRHPPPLSMENLLLGGFVPLANLGSTS
jgi:hypothetical protein